MRSVEVGGAVALVGEREPLGRWMRTHPSPRMPMRADQGRGDPDEPGEGSVSQIPDVVLLLWFAMLYVVSHPLSLSVVSSYM